MSVIKEIALLKLVLPGAELVSGTCATKWLKRIESMNTWSRSRVIEWQNTQLQAFVKHAYGHTKYYHDLFDSLKINPDSIQTSEDLKQVPIITKDIVNAHYQELIPDDLSGMKYRHSASGGTTGKPMKYLCSEDVWGYVTAAKIYYWRKNGYRYGDDFVALGSASLFSEKPSHTRRIYDRIRHEHPLNCVNLTDKICQSYYEYIKKNRIRFIYGYAAAIYIFASYIDRSNLDLAQIDSVFTTSENLPDHYRKLIERVFKCSVMDCYGARDAGITAYETKRYCYEVGYNVIAETIDEIADNTGSLLSTNILNYCFPLIRYKFGDEAQLASSNNDYDYNGQVIQRIVGRTSNVLRLENGHSLTATGLSMIMKHFDIVAFDFKKDGVNSVSLRIQSVPGKYSKEQETIIVDTIIKYIGNDCTLHIDYVEDFPTLPNGKRSYFLV